MTPLTSILGLSAAVSGLAYGFLYLQAPTSALRSLAKTLPLAALTLAAYWQSAPWLLILALGLSALGDLSLSFNGDKAFLLGLSSFLFAHLAYIAAFFQIFELSGLVGLLLPFLIAVPVTFGAGALIVPFAPKELRPAVALYCLVIGTMLYCALVFTLQSAWLTLGAAFFVMSDFVLGFALFRATELSAMLRKRCAHFVWWSYLAAQALLFWALHAQI